MADELDVRNKKDPRCPLCCIPDLAQYDKEIFYRRLGHNDFVDKVRGQYVVPEQDFRKHIAHLYVHRPMQISANTPSVEILSELISALHSQIIMQAQAGDIDNGEYSRKLEMVKSLIELRGKYEGAFKERVEVTTDFKKLLIGRMMESIAEPAVIDVTPTKDEVKLLDRANQDADADQTTA